MQVHVVDGGSWELSDRNIYIRGVTGIEKVLHIERSKYKLIIDMSPNE